MRASLLLVVLAPLVAGQYKYVFYDGDEAEYEDFNRCEVKERKLDNIVVTLSLADRSTEYSQGVKQMNIL